MLPHELVSRKISSGLPSRPLETHLIANHPEETAAVVGEIMEEAEEAERLVILADAGALRGKMFTKEDDDI